MNLMQKAYNKLFKKSYSPNPSGSIATLEEFTNLLQLTGDYAILAKTGYIENVIANTCIKRTCEAMNSIPLTFKINGEVIEGIPKDKLLKSIIHAINDPSDCYDSELFLESIQSQLFIKGEAYIYLPEDALGNIAGMQYLRPDKVNKITSDRDTVHEYQYNNGSEQITFNREFTKYSGSREAGRVENPDTLNGRFNMVIFRTYNPSSEVEGLSRLGSCALSIEGHNNALTWNNSVMKNAGKSSGMLSFGHNESGSLDAEAIKSIADKLKYQTTGKNRGSILVANAPAKFEKFNMTSQEMDFIEGIIQRAIEICNALDYPPYLLGLNGATFNNQDAAKLALYENSAIPKTKRIYKNIAKFISRKYDINFEIAVDLADVEAMAPRYEMRNDATLKQYTANVITLDEAREKIGYEEAPEGQGSLFYGDFNRSNTNQNQET